VRPRAADAPFDTGAEDLRCPRVGRRSQHQEERIEMLGLGSGAGDERRGGFVRQTGPVLDEGAAVVVYGRDEGRAAAVATAIRAAGRRADIAIGDLATDAGADAVAAAALSAGPIDILVNNAGSYDRLSWADTTPEVWARACRTTTPRAPPGTTLRCHSPESSRGRASRRGARSDHGRHGACPTGGHRSRPRLGESPEDIEAAASAEWIPNDVGRFGRPEESAGAVVYLAGPYAAYVSGTTLRVDGGTRTGRGPRIVRRVPRRRRWRPRRRAMR
jgi:3-oxoacyl-[acyl-carrier protein] reductase